MKILSNIIKKDNYNYLVIIFILLCIIIKIFSNDMHKDTKSNLPHVTSEAAAIAISNLKYNLGGYTGYKEIRKKFIDNGFLDNKILNESLKIKNIEENEIFFINDFDLGYVDFYKIAFYLFDYKIDSLVYLYLSFFIISILIYLYQFKNNNTAITILIFFLVSYYFILITTVKTPSEFGVVYNYRLMTMLGIVPLLHLTFFSVFKENKINLFSFFSLIIQSSLLACLYYIRITSLWMFIFLIFVFFLNYYFILKEKSEDFKKLNSNKLNFLIKMFFINFKKSIPIIIVFFLVFNFSFFYEKNKNDLYYEKLGKHVFWHSIFLGIISYDDEIFKLNTKLDRKTTNPWHDSNYFCNKDNYKSENYIKSELRSLLCKKSLLSNIILKYYIKIKYFLSKYPNDQDAYSSVIVKLYSDNNNEYEIFNFKSNEKVDYFSEFWIFKLSNDLKKKYKNIDYFDAEKIKEYRKFSWSEDFNWVEYEKTLKDITLDNIPKNPIKLISLYLIVKPIHLVKNFLIYYTGNFISLFLLIVAISNAVKYSKIDISKKYKTYFMILFLLLSSSLISPIITYPDVVSICDSSLVLWICILFFITIFIKKKLTKKI